MLLFTLRIPGLRVRAPRLFKRPQLGVCLFALLGAECAAAAAPVVKPLDRNGL